MSDAWIYGEEPPAGGAAPGTTTLIEGTTFCISATNGDIEPSQIHGLFVRDTRFLSCWRLFVDGALIQAVSPVTSGPQEAAFVARVRPSAQQSESGLLIVRRRIVGDGMAEELEVRNLTDEPTHVALAIEVATDFAHLFEVKADQVRPRGFHSVEARNDEMILSFRDQGRSRRIRISLPPGSDAGPGEVRLPIELAPRDRWRTCFEFHVELDRRSVQLRHHCGEQSGTYTASRLTEQRWHTPIVRTASEPLSHALSAAAEDLEALRIYDPARPGEAVVAAGAPWYMALFGRDALITSWMTLGADPLIADGTLRALARYQGSVVDDTTEEQPGRILHEVRFRFEGVGDDGASAYYGSIDATPLFVVLVAEARRWGASEEFVAEMLPHVDRALDWIENFGDRDGDGFVEYARPHTHRGLLHQGWKDSNDGISFLDGRLAEPPIALCEVQGYVYAAYAGRYRLAREAGDLETQRRCATRAAELKDRFNEAFFIPELGYYALGLDQDKKQIDSLTSNIGHLLWSGIVDHDKAAVVAAHLMSEQLFTGFGVRTLGTSMARYNPMSYHNGSVWPHDNAIIAAGLLRYGFVEAAQEIALGMIEASASFGGHLPELFCGFDRHEFARPVAYPAACTPQSWASASPYSLLRTLLGFEPDVPAGRLYVAPALGETEDSLVVEGIPIAERRVRLEVTHNVPSLEGLPEGVALVTAPAPLPNGPLVG